MPRRIPMKLTYSYKEVFSAATDAFKNNLVAVDTIVTENGQIYIANSDVFLAANGIIGAAAVRTNIGPFIVMTNKAISETLKSFLLAHEEGHIILGHLDSIKKGNLFKRILSAYFSVQKIELEADTYAVKKLGKKEVVKALREFHNSEKLPLSTKIELSKRIKAVKNL